MRPILYPADTLQFTDNGIGTLTDAISCIVTEERNGAYYLEMEYPQNGIHAEDIELDNILFVYANDTKNAQAFRIVTINKSITDRILVTAYHISYDLNYFPVEPFVATGISDILSGIEENTVGTCPFTITSNIENTTSQYNQIVPKSVRSCLGGSENSLLQLFSGSNPPEYEWDNFAVHLWTQRGADHGVTLRYAKNIMDLQNEINTSNATAVLPFWTNADETVVIIGDLQYASVVDPDVPKTIVLDLSDKFDDTPTKYQINQAGLEYVTAAQICNPTSSITVSFVNLADTEEYKDIVPLETVRLCDTVTVIYEPLNISVNFKVIKTVYNSLLERYESIELGNAKSSLGKTLAGAITDINSVIKSNGKIISVVQKLDEEMGEWSSTITEITENGMKSIKPQYALSTSRDTVELTLLYVSEDTIVGSSSFVRSEVGNVQWLDEMPEVPGGYYLWARDVITWLDDSVTYENVRLLEGISANTTLIYLKQSQLIQRADEILQRVEEEAINGERRYSELSVKADEIDAKVTDETQNLWTQVNQNTSDISNTVGRIDEQGQYIELAKTMLDEDGFHVETAGTDRSSTLTGDGLTVTDSSGNEVLVASGTDKGVIASNLTANNYLILNYGTFIARFEPYSDIYDSEQIGIYVD